MTVRVHVIGIAGGSGSGKTTLARALHAALGVEQAALLSQDAYYRALKPEAHAAPDQVDFDHPDAIDAALLATHLGALAAGRAVDVPRYDFAVHRPVGTDPLAPRPVVVVEGILLLTDPALRSRIDLAVFVDAPSGLRRARRLQRDVAERGRDRDEVLGRMTRFVEPAYARWVEPSAAHAHLRVSGVEPVEDGVAVVLAALARLRNR